MWTPPYNPNGHFSVPKESTLHMFPIPTVYNLCTLLPSQRGTSRVSPMTPSAGPFFPSSSTTAPPVFTSPIHRVARPVRTTTTSDNNISPPPPSPPPPSLTLSLGTNNYGVLKLPFCIRTLTHAFIPCVRERAHFTIAS